MTGTIDPANPTSPSYFPEQSTTIVGISTKEEGSQFKVMAKCPGCDWEIVCTRTGVFTLSTPDPAVEYHIEGINLNLSTPVYMGPVSP